ncbi:MAG: hypothetical protein CL840_17125 [Crocinitomicaceae bacterium]|nr:hypothetical protein [Crocinitomicaceae bacterium]|tara:strand:+ start:6409 stop:6828 length:420 start_codon:yes stop_codon:yes gene_type:complete
MEYEKTGNKEYDLFLKELERDNQILTQVLAIHLFCDRQLNRIAGNKGLNKKSFEGKNFSYKLDLLRLSENIPIWLYENLVILNKVRNGFAHEHDYKLSEIRDGVIRFANGKGKLLSKLDSEKSMIAHLHALTLIELHLI